MYLCLSKEAGVESKQSTATQKTFFFLLKEAYDQRGVLEENKGIKK